MIGTAIMLGVGAISEVAHAVANKKANEKAAAKAKANARMQNQLDYQNDVLSSKLDRMRENLPMANSPNTAKIRGEMLDNIDRINVANAKRNKDVKDNYEY